MTTLVLTFGAKAFNDTELCNACFTDGNTTIIATGQTNKNVTVKFLKKHMAYVNFTSLFYSLCSTVAPKIYNFLKTKHTTHIYSGRKDKGCKNVAQTSKTRQVKHPKWAQLLRSRFDCYFSRLQKIWCTDCKKSDAPKPSRERMWGLNVPYAVIIEICVKE